jgi:hypothetical protein
MEEVWDEGLLGLMAEDAELEMPNDDLTKGISELAEELYELGRKIDEAEQALKIQESRYKLLSEKLLPDAMLAARVTSQGLENGFTLQLKDDVHTYISVENQKLAHSWLREVGLGDIIDMTLTMPLGKGADPDLMAELHTELMGVMIRKAPGVEIRSVEKVHDKTLKAAINQLIKKHRKGEGVEVPPKLFGVHERKFAEVKKGKNT